MTEISGRATILALVAVISLLGPALAQQDGTDLAAFRTAVAERDMDAAARISYARVEGSTSSVDHREWLARLGEVNLLRHELPEAASNFRDACIAVAGDDVSTLDAICAGGAALVEVLDPGDIDESESLINLARQRETDLPSPTATILTRLATAMYSLNTDPDASVRDMSLVEAALQQRGIKQNPELTALVAAGFLKVAEIYWAANIDHSADELEAMATDHAKRAVALHSSVVDRLDPSLFYTLYDASTFSEDPDFVRTLVIWMVDMAEADEDPASAQNTFYLATTHLSSVFLKDTLLEVLWRWQAHLESKFGPSSADAAMGLIAIADLMFSEMREEEGHELRNKALGILKAAVGEESEAYQKAANSILYTSYLAMKKIMDESQASIDATTEPSPLPVPGADPEAQGTLAGDETSEQIANEAITQAINLGGTDGIQVLLKAWGEVLDTGATGAERKAKKVQAARLTEKAWEIAKSVKAYDHYTFSAVVGRMADLKEEAAGLPAALAFLDEVIEPILPSSAEGVVARVQLLQEYADLLKYSDDRTIGRQAMLDRYVELLAMPISNDVVGEAVVDALIGFAESFEYREELDEAKASFQAVQDLIDQNPAIADDFEVDAVRTAIDTLNGKDGTLAKADVEFERIGKMSDDDPSKVQDLETAALGYRDFDGDYTQVLRFTREAVRLQKAQILKIVGSMPLSGSEEFESRKGYFESLLTMNLEALVGGPSKTATIADADVQEALDLFQWRPNLLAGNSLLRSSARATLKPTERTLARQLEDAIRQWQAVDEELVQVTVGGQSTERLAALSARQAALHARVENAVELLADKSELFRGLSGRGDLSLKAVREALVRDEAVVAFARSNIRGLHALVVTPTGGALIDLERDAAGERTFDTQEKLDAAFSAFQSSFAGTNHFDVASAVAIYEILFRPLEPYLTNTRRLTVVPDASFPSIAYPALLRGNETRSEDGPLSDFLIQRYSIAIALTFESFVATRTQPAFDGQVAFVGFANPRITDPDCPPASLFAVDTGDGSASLCELPQTLDHADFIARALGVDPSQTIVSGNDLTMDGVVAALNDPIRVVIFATHGLMGDEMAEQTAWSEPALLLSASANDERSGWLMASDIERMTIDAGLVVLSACNTSAGSSAGAQAFSGLARAFFEAGARSLLVTNWYVDVGQVSEFLRFLGPRLRDLDRAELATSVREVMLERIPLVTHPRDWAVFTTLGG